MKIKILNLIAVMVITISVCYAGSLTVESDKQEFKDSDSKIYLEGNVKVKTDDANVLSPRAVVEVDKKNSKVNKVEFKEKAYSFAFKNGKKHEIKAQILELSLLNKFVKAEGNTISSVMENDKPIVIVTADKQEYHKQGNVMKAFGRVNIVYKDVDTFSNEAYVYLDDQNDVKKIELIGQAILNQDRSKIKAQKLIYDNVSEEAKAFGDVYTDVTSEDKNVKVWSDYQYFDKKTNFMTATGQVKVVYENYTATGPKVNVYPDKTTKKLNEAVFLGRSTIESDGRTVVADRISITMNPKDFKAEGNVKSTIPNLNY